MIIYLNIKLIMTSYLMKIINEIKNVLEHYQEDITHAEFIGESPSFNYIILEINPGIKEILFEDLGELMKGYKNRAELTERLYLSDETKPSKILEYENSIRSEYVN